MKVLVTGASGFIGYHVIHELLKRKVAVIATSRNKEKAEQQDWFDRVQFVQHTIGKEDNDKLFTKFHEPDCAIHLAWDGLHDYRSLFHFEKILPDQYSFLKQLINAGLRDVTITGTCFEYGMKNGCLTEDIIPEPANSYALAKNTLRLFLEYLQKEKEFSLKWARLFYMYGKGQNPNSLLSQLDKALYNGDTVFNMSGGEQVRDYLQVEEVAKNIVNITLQNKITGIINCCSGKPVTVKAVVENYLRKRNKHISLNLGYYPYADYEPMEFWGDATKLNLVQ